MTDPGLSNPGIPPSFRLGAYIVLAVLLLLVSVARWRVLDTPMERDEGEYAYAGQLVLDGIPPYQQTYNMKFPGMYYAYAGILAAFGQTPRAIHLGLWLANLVSILCVFAIGRRLLGTTAASVAAVAYAALSLDLGTLGLWAHATQFVVLFSTAGFWVLGLPSSNRAWRLFLGGLLLGAGVLMKQHGILLVALAGLEALWPRPEDPADGLRSRLARAGILAVGAAVPLAMVLVVLARHGLLGRFYFWTFTYARYYGTHQTWPGILYGFAQATREALSRAGLLWALGLCGLAVVWRGPWPWRTRAWLLAYFVASFVMLCPGWYFRPHYYVLLQPAMALLVGALAAWGLARLAAIARLPRWARIGGPVVLASLLLGQYAYAERELFGESPDQINFSCYPTHAFRETARVASYIRATTAPGDSIGILGSEPHVFFLSGRRSATGYIYAYPLVEVQPFAARMQREMIAEMQASQPAMMVFMRIPASWGFRRSSDRTVLRWALAYISLCYRLDAAIDMTQPEERRYFWGARTAAAHVPPSYAIMVYRRTSDAACRVAPDAADLPSVPMPTSQ